MWSLPELIETAVLAESKLTDVKTCLSALVPSPSCPNELSPQHWRSESSSIVQKWDPPLEIVVSVNIEPDWNPGELNPSETGLLISVIAPSLDAK